MFESLNPIFPSWKRISMSILNRLGILEHFNFSIKTCFRNRTISIPIYQGVGGNLLSLERSEEWMWKLLEQLLDKTEGSFMDVGVNIGQTLIKVKTIDHDRMYIGLEPNYLCLFYVYRLIELNTFKQCRIFPMALGDEFGFQTLELPEGSFHPSASTVQGFRDSSFYDQSMDVSVVPGDKLAGFLPDNQQIRIMKIDVEGAELEVIKGFTNLLANGNPIIICEILPAPGMQSDVGQMRIQRQNELITLLKEYGYHLYRVLNANSLKEIDRIEPHHDFSLCNYVFVKDQDRHLLSNVFDE